jgi:PAS domain-containing protein
MTSQAASDIATAQEPAAGALSMVPERNAVHEYEEAQRTSMVQLIRGGTVMVSLLHIAYFVADAWHVPIHAMLLLDAACVIIGLTGFAVTNTQWFVRHWRATALFICTSEVMATTWLTTIDPDTTRLLITVLLYSCGSASLVPWSPVWQQSLNLTCLLALIAQATWLPLAEAHRVDRWIAMLIAAGVGHFATIFGERFRHQLLHRARMLDEAHSMLMAESRRSERAVQHLLRTEEQLRASEQRFELFMQRLPGPAFIRDTEGRYVFINERALRTTRTTAADWIGRTDAEILTLAPDEVARIRDSDRQILETGKAVRVV